MEKYTTLTLWENDIFINFIKGVYLILWFCENNIIRYNFCKFYGYIVVFHFAFHLHFSNSKWTWSLFHIFIWYTSSREQPIHVFCRFLKVCPFLFEKKKSVKETPLLVIDTKKKKRGQSMSACQNREQAMVINKAQEI